MSGERGAVHGLLVTILLGAALLGACAPVKEPDVPLSTPAAPQASPVTPGLTTEAHPGSALLRAQLAPFAEATFLLDDVCFEALAALNGQSWVWRSQADLDAFYAQIDEAGWCPDSLVPPQYDFADRLLVGTTRTAQGCDAAFQLLALVQDARTRQLTLQLALEARGGCPYELVEPVIVVVPPPPPDYAVSVQVSAGP